MEKSTFGLKGGKEHSMVQPRKEVNARDDSDSGLDNNSDVGSSCDEHSRSSSSELDDSSHESIQPARPERKKKSKEHASEQSAPRDAQLEKSREAGEKVNGTAFPQKPEVAMTSATPPAKATAISILINESRSEVNVEAIPEYFRLLAEGQFEAVDFGGSMFSRPEWLDIEKFKRGQRFASANLFSLNFAEMLSLIMLFSFKPALKPLIYTGMSDTPYKAFRRYLHTLLKVKSWYEEDIWSERDNLGRKNIGLVNWMHKSVYTRMTNASPEDLANATSLGDPNQGAVWCPLTKVILDDFRHSCPVTSNPYKMGNQVWINQFDMAITQFGFVGLVVAYPEYFGLHYVTKEDLEGFIHMWRGIGYLLGIKDKYNYCNGDYETVKQRTKDLIELAVKPCFREVDENWEHMSRCMITGISFYVPYVEFESSLLYLCFTIGVDMPRLRNEVSLRHLLKYQGLKLINFIERIPGVMSILNKQMIAYIRSAEEASEEQLAKWKAMEFPFLTGTSGSPTVSSYP